MSWTSHAKKISRTPCVVIEIDLDYYDDAGVAAVNDDGSLCYRTPETTDQVGPFPLVTITRRWMTSTQRAIPELGAIPCLQSFSIATEEIRPGRGLGYFGQATITLTDFVDDDRREDPFYSDASRASVDHKGGTYFGKLKARNPWWIGRNIRIIEGWATDGVWHAADAITHNYLIRDVQGPNGNSFTITAAGPLQLLNLGDIECPTPSRGLLLANITNSQTTAKFSSVDDAALYPASGTIRISDEVMTFTRSTDTLTIVRATNGSTADVHNAGDTIQLCASYVNQRLIDIVKDILVTYGLIDPSLLALDEWESEQLSWLSTYILSGIVSKPAKIMEIVQELLEASASMLWWDDFTGLVRLRAIRPALSISGTWTDRFHLLKQVQQNMDISERVSRCDILIDLRSADKDPKEASSYRTRVVGAPLGEDVTENGSAQVKLMASRWLTSSQIGLAVRASAQTTLQMRDGRQTYTVVVAAKDAGRQVGDILEILTREIVDRNGEPTRVRCVVVKRDPVAAGSQYTYLLEKVPFGGRYAFMTAVGIPDYASAPAYLRDPGAFMANAAGAAFGPNDPPYLMS